MIAFWTNKQQQNKHYPTYRLKPKYITTDKKAGIFPNPRIQIQLPMYWLYQNYYHRKPAGIYTTRNAPRSQWLLQKEGFKSRAISFSEPGVSEAPTAPPHRQGWNGDAETTQTAPRRHCWPKWPKDTRAATQVMGVTWMCHRVPFTPFCVMTSSGNGTRLGSKRLTSRKHNWARALFSLQCNTCRKG